MIVNDSRLQFSARAYSALLSLYPAHFRFRFGPEMSQVFRASCRHEAARGDVALLVFWLRTFKDLTVSIAQQYGRDLTHGIDSNNPLVAFIDSLLIPSMIALNLFVLGPLITALFAGAAAAEIPLDDFMMTSLIVSLVLATLGILRALIVARLRPTVRLWVKLS